MIIISILSIASLILVVYFIWNDKKLSVHPNELIMIICLVEATFCYASLIDSQFITAGYTACYIRLYAALWLNQPIIKFFHRDQDMKTDVLQENTIIVALWSNQILRMFFQEASIIANMCLCHDLIATLKSPFEVHSSRLKFYKVAIFSCPVILLSIIWVLSSYYDDDQQTGTSSKPQSYIYVLNYQSYDKGDSSQ